MNLPESKSIVFRSHDTKLRLPRKNLLLLEYNFTIKVMSQFIGYLPLIGMRENTRFELFIIVFKGTQSRFLLFIRFIRSLTLETKISDIE